MPEKDHINYYILPEHCRGGMRRYIEDGVIPGDFLQAVIRNNLVDALGKADDINCSRIMDYGSFLYNEVPLGCWGSKTKMLKWNKEGGLNGPEKAQG